jgi:hypothetical protein
MTYQDRDLRSGASNRDPRIERDLRPDPTLRATPSQAAWSWVATAAIVFILGVTFYGINNAQRTNEGGRPTVTASAPTTRAAAPAETTGRGGTGDQAEPQPPAGGTPGNDGAR